jgi:anthranilate/para-aminobenzoate synthase component I
LEYISAGDIYQLNLSQRFSAPWVHSEAALFTRMRHQSPAEFSAFIGSSLHRGSAVLSISPELFLRVRGRQVLTRPIKGTRPRAASAAGDETAARELAGNAKERAELNMIIDLERNDLGRVCDYGSVEVLSEGDIETLPTLLHRVASIRGRLHESCSSADLLQAAFPGGSITGAPKLRAMQIISELEDVPRGPYCGAIGWIGVNGDMELSIAIRTAVLDVKAQLAHYHAGAGIVADSNPRSEYEETLHKAAAFFRAVNARPHNFG